MEILKELFYPRKWIIWSANGFYISTPLTIKSIPFAKEPKEFIFHCFVKHIYSLYSLRQFDLYICPSMSYVLVLNTYIGRKSGDCGRLRSDERFD